MPAKPDGPFQILDRIYKRVIQNLSGITTASGYRTTVAGVFEAAVPFRQEDITGPIISLVDVNNDIERLTANRARMTFGYDLYAWVVEENPEQLPLELREMLDDVWNRHYEDESLKAADIALGGSGDRQLTRHAIVTVEKEFSVPDGVAKIEVEGVLDFDVL